MQSYNRINYIKVLFGLGCMISTNKTIMLLIMTWFLTWNENKTNEMSTNYFGSAKLHFHLFIQQSQYNSLSFLAPFFTSAHHSIWRCLKILQCSSFTTLISTFPIHTRYNFKFASFTRMKLLRPKSWNEV